jgi:hypothetical protein
MNNDTLQSPTNRAEKEELDYGTNVITQLLGATIVAFGATNDGEILLVARKDGQRLEFVIGKDESGDVALFEVETEESPE